MSDLYISCDELNQEIYRRTDVRRAVLNLVLVSDRLRSTKARRDFVYSAKLRAHDVPLVIGVSYSLGAVQVLKDAELKSMLIEKMGEIVEEKAGVLTPP